jgi:hypothetical protein
MIFPTDFRQKVAMPPAINGNGYPYKLSAEDLMQNFIFAALDVDSEQTGPILLQIKTDNGVRKISILLYPPSFGTWLLGAVDGEEKWMPHSTGGTGSITFLDCDGAEVGRLDWSNGLITTESNQSIEGGCQVVSSSAP